jgi:N-methylhydantoinase B
VIVTIDVTWRCLSQLLLASPPHHKQAMAVWSGTSMAPIFAGTSQHGFAFAATEMSHFGGGGGARTYADGVDTAGIVFNTTPNMPNIEDQEAEYPVLYLFRRHLRDSGGPGLHRGGRSAELAYMVYGAPTGKLEGLFAGTGAEMPNAIGVAGGMPGAAIKVVRVIGTDLNERVRRAQPLPAALEDVAGKLEVLSCKHERTAMAGGDVWYHSWQAGGGFGDPLRREPARVGEDVERGAVSAQAARLIYGVALRPDGSVDAPATKTLRTELRATRLAQSRAPSAGSAVWRFAGRGAARFGSALDLDFDRGAIRCADCGCTLGKPDEDLLPALRVWEAPLTAAGPTRGEDYDRGRFRLRHVLCPGCGTALEVHLAFDGAPWPSMDVRIGLTPDMNGTPHAPRQVHT